MSVPTVRHGPHGDLTQYPDTGGVRLAIELWRIKRLREDVVALVRLALYNRRSTP